jgi:hypothetical protein
MGIEQFVEPSPKQEQSKTGGIWLMVQSRVGGPFNRIWFGKAEVRKFDNTTMEA